MSQVAEKTEKRAPKTAQIKDAAFKWDDPLDLESQLTEEERMVRDTARDYAQEKLFPRVLAANRDGAFDPAIMREMGRLGMLGATIPQDYGGAGLSYVCYGLIAHRREVLDHACAGRRRRGGVGEARRQDSRLHRRARHQRTGDAEDRRQIEPARLDHRRAGARRRAGAGRQFIAERVRSRR